MAQIRSDDRNIALIGDLTLDQLGPLQREIDRIFRQQPHSALYVDLSQIDALDTAGAVFLRRLPELARQAGKELALSPLPERFQSFFAFVAQGEERFEAPPPRTGYLEQMGNWVRGLNHQLIDFSLLASDLTWTALAALFRPGGIRRGSLVSQAIAVGSSALPIISLILFLIGAVSSLQAAAQLRKFGADIFVAELLAIGITRELGPLMTAIIVAGRSGSAIAAEVATMKFTEEIDALQTMALDPLRFIAVPKLWAMLLCLPMLTIMADLIGILGGVFIGVTIMQIPPTAFIDQALSALFLRDVVTGLIKSVSFAWAITVIGVYRGLGFSGGADGVGRATTAAVVTSIFGIIALDCFWGLLFYLR
jgi:phospholipid/cholesterol/gamma-HCH transport system permease protein